ncbi:hypothetical protein ABF87_03430 [Nitrosomonas sp. JL21]|nr:hypothetical protein [Nitrosomonas sp. JL21]
MIMNKRLTMMLLSGCMLGNAAILHAAPSYTFTDLSPASSFAIANAINNHDQIAGYQSIQVPLPGIPGSTVSTFTATLWNGATGSATFLTTPAFDLGSVANDLNDAGQVVGFTSDLAGKTAAIRWENGITTPLPSMNAFYANPLSVNTSGEIVGIIGPDDSSRFLAHWDKNLTPTLQGSSGGDYAINDSGQIAGSFEFSPGNFQAGISLNGNLTAIGTLGASSDTPLDINDQGMVVGFGVTPSNNMRAFLYDGDTLSALRMIPGIGGQTFANAINELGQVVGSSVAAGGAFEHATLWNGYQVFDLNDFLDESSKNAGWVLTDALDINDQGWIVGEAENTISGEKHAFLFSSDHPIPPVPESQTYLMLLAGLALLGLKLQKKHLF